MNGLFTGATILDSPTTASDILLRTFASGGVDTCFANPGTSELDLVKSLGRSEIRSILCLFEGVVAGAADGYGRVRNAPALTLTHLGPGFAGAIQNLHNAKRASTPVINLIGQNPVDHSDRYDVGLNSDIASLAKPVSHQFVTIDDARAVSEFALEALKAAASEGGQVITLAVPSDVQAAPLAAETPIAASPAVPGRAAVDFGAVEQAARLIRDGGSVVLLLGGSGVEADAQIAAARIAAAFPNVRLLLETFSARLPRGVDLPPIGKLPYFSEAALAALAGASHVILAGAKEPVAYFNTPGLPDELAPAGSIRVLASPAADVEDALAKLVQQLGADGAELPQRAHGIAEMPGRDTPLLADLIGPILAASLVEGSIVTTESPSAGPGFAKAQINAPRHLALGLTGGAIGLGLPLALGAAVGAPGTPVYALQSDGSAVYTISALWTMAREQLPITIILVANRRYEILNVELLLRGLTEIPERIRSLTDLGSPAMNWVALANGFGVEARSVSNCGELMDALAGRENARAPLLIEANI
ncbi:acetolactate synthase large subunit [Sphingopyxis terrae]|uniref:acetolactate synthase large subunit n=1 Tax=Sphingopyxis terrae TaxID=33052 RepID=UPI002A173502|nr:acetolactate synthase large subunit [Sphingopyxis terrae]MDX8356487.1 acetolactate synthase large subunit [Sphingopyxis terrae]